MKKYETNFFCQPICLSDYLCNHHTSVYSHQNKKKEEAMHDTTGEGENKI